MLRGLLEDRFSVRVHLEQRPQDAYVLVLSRRDGHLGSALHTSAATCAAADWSAPPRSERWCGIQIGRGEMTGRGISMLQFAAILGNNVAVGRPVRDTTGLSGTFDFQIEFAALSQSGPIDSPVDASADLQATLFTALQEQLGLKLQGGVSAPVDVLVIDQASRPTPN